MKGPFLSFFRDCFFVPPFTPTAPLVCSSHYSLQCLHWLSWDCRNGYHNRNRLGPQPAYMANSHIKSEAFVGKHLLSHNMLLLFLFLFFLWTCITHTDCSRSGIPTVNNAVSDFNFKSLVDFSPPPFPVYWADLHKHHLTCNISENRAALWPTLPLSEGGDGDIVF